MAQGSVDGRVMLAVTLLIVAAILGLAILAGPFGRELTMKQQPPPHWPATGPPSTTPPQGAAAPSRG